MKRTSPVPATIPNLTMNTCLIISGGSRIFPRGVHQLRKKTIILQIFCRKLHENERIWAPQGRPAFMPPPPPPPTPLRSANDYIDRIEHFPNWTCSWWLHLTSAFFFNQKSPYIFISPDTLCIQCTQSQHVGNT